MKQTNQPTKGLGAPGLRLLVAMDMVVWLVIPPLWAANQIILKTAKSEESKRSKNILKLKSTKSVWMK